MELDRNLNFFLDQFYELVSIVGLKKTCHILDTDRVSAHFFKLFCKFSEAFVRVNGARRVADRRLNVTALFLGRVDRGLEVTGVVESVEDTENINTVCDGFLNEVFYDVIGVMTVAENVLTSEKHLELGIFNFISDFAKSFPRIFVKEAQAGVKRCAAPCFESMVTDFIHLFENGEHFLRRHSRCDQGLVRVTEDSLTNFNFCHRFWPPFLS